MPRHARAPVHPQFFTCTFCWHLSRGPPRVLGRSWRLTCEPCYNAIIDLAIYWVCGEVVCRGSECVSLGWCFWHRACYGCLLCGSQLIAQGTTVRELFCDENWPADAPEQGIDIQSVATRAKEIQDVPLCAYCIADIEADKLDHAEIVQKALRRTDKTDGGLSRSRWERKQGTVSRSVMGQIKRVPGKMAMVSEETAAQTSPVVSKRTFDGAGSEASTEEEMACVVPLNSTIYVSILDPLWEPAFKPHPTKPIPQWIRGAPSQRQSRPQDEQHPVSTLNEDYHDANSTSATSPTTLDPLIICPTRPSSPLLHTPPQCLRRRRSQARDAVRNALDTSHESITIPSHKISYVTSETLKRPSSRLTQQISSRGSSPSRPYRADHRASSPSQALTSRPTTPARKADHPMRPTHSQQLAHPEPTAKAQEGTDMDSPSSQYNRSSSPLAAAVISKLQRMARKTPPTQSDEYLHLYKPVQTDRGGSYRTPMSSIAVAGRKRGRRVERADFDAMIRGTAGPAGNPRSNKDGSNKDESYETREQQTKAKRQSLQKELKRLLGRGGDTETVGS